MQKFSAYTRGVKTTPTPYACRWDYFWLGLKDYVLERTSTNATSSEATTPKRQVSPGALLVVAFLVMAALAVLVSQLAPMWVASPFSPSPRRLAEFTVALTSMSAVALMLAVPAVVGWRVWRFCNAMCVRGWEIRTGQRAAVRLG